MTFYTTTARAASRATPFAPDRRHRASFARDATFAAFGWHARALDQANFLDRKPWQMPRRAPGARF